MPGFATGNWGETHLRRSTDTSMLSVVLTWDDTQKPNIRELPYGKDQRLTSPIPLPTIAENVNNI